MKDCAFIFDMDGVIVDSNPYHKIALKKFCEKYGHHLSEDELLTKIYGRTNKEWITNIFGKLSKERLAGYAEEKEALYRKLYEKEIRPVNGLVDFLQRLEGRQILRAIATSAPRANVDFTLSKTGTGRFFSVILDESHVKHGKPNPEIYLNTAHALHLPPLRCVVFEDSLSGVAAAKTAGAKVIGITTTHTAQELAATDFTIHDFTGLDPLELMERVL